MNIKIKTTYLILGTILTLSSCSQEDMPYPATVRSRQITFLSSLPEVTSRAKDLTDNNLNYFRITAFNPNDKDSIKNGVLREYIKNDTLFKDNESGRFSSEDCLWPETGKEDHVLHFFAYYPHLPAGTRFVNNTTVSGGKANFDYKADKFKISTDISYHNDFVTAYASGSMNEKLFEGIKLQFKHQLSRIEVRAKSSNKSCRIEIAGVRIGGVRTQASYNFKAEEGAGDWTMDQSVEKEHVEYIYRAGEKIVTLDNTATEVSIMGGADGANYALLLPDSDTDGWDFANDNTNSKKGLYLSVLLRVLDKTPGGNYKQQYPYFDNSQGLNAMNISRVYLVTDNNGEIKMGQVYKGNDGKYYYDSANTRVYNVPSGYTVREFGWAAVPVTGTWEAGNYYTYTLDYTSGVGLHDPDVSGDVAPKAGDPIISDRVGVTVNVNAWQGGQNTTHSVIVPGS